VIGIVMLFSHQPEAALIPMIAAAVLFTLAYIRGKRLNAAEEEQRQKDWIKKHGDLRFYSRMDY
jgi:hypothetical protein